MTFKSRKIVGGIALALSKLFFVLPLLAFPIIAAYATYSQGFDVIVYVVVVLVFLGTLIPRLIFTLASPLVRFAHEIGRRLSTPSAEHFLQESNFRPIVYLRSFSLEKDVSAEERALSSILRKAGPLVAIGRPSEWAPRLGAYRFYFKDSEWKAAVGPLMKRALLVVVLAGASEGLRWELEYCRKTLEPNHLIILIPDNEALFKVFADTFSSATGVAINDLHIPFGTKLPPEANGSGWRLPYISIIFSNWGFTGKSPPRERGRIAAIVHFDKKWKPMVSLIHFYSISDDDVASSNDSTWLLPFEKALDESLIQAGREDLWKFMARTKFDFFDAVTGGYFRTNAWSRYAALAGIIIYVAAIVAFNLT